MQELLALGLLAPAGETAEPSGEPVDFWTFLTTPQAKISQNLVNFCSRIHLNFELVNSKFSFATLSF